MSFLSLPQQARKPLADVLPDGRKRLTRFFKIATTSPNIPPELNQAPGTADPWPSADAPTGWQGLLLTYKVMKDSVRGFPQGAEDDKPVLELTYEQISATGETQTGGTPQTQLPNGREQVEFSYVMFSTSTYTPQVPGTTAAPSPFGTYYLWEEKADDDGTLRKITRTYQTAGIVATDDQSLFEGALLTKKITSFYTVPSTPSGYTLVGTPVQNPNGYPLYDYSYAKGNGQADIHTQAEPDGAITYVVTNFGATAATPSYPGTGSYSLVSYNPRQANGYYANTAVFKKWPADQTRKETIQWQKPGLASFTGTQLTLSPPATRTLLADVLVTYSATQDTTTPWEVESYASFVFSYIPYANPGASPTPGSPPADITVSGQQPGQRGLAGYLSGATSVSGTNDYYNGSFCQVYSAVLVSSTPSARPTGATVLRVHNEPYVTDTSGTVIYRISKTSYTF